MDLYLIHHYIQRGHSKDEILNLSKVDKFFYLASIKLQKEEELDKVYRISL